MPSRPRIATSRSARIASTVIPSIRGRAAGQIAIQGMANKQIELITPTLRTKGSAGKPIVAVWVYRDNSLVIAHLDFMGYRALRPLARPPEPPAQFRRPRRPEPRALLPRHGGPRPARQGADPIVPAEEDGLKRFHRGPEYAAGRTAGSWLATRIDMLIHPCDIWNGKFCERPSCILPRRLSYLAIVLKSQADHVRIRLERIRFHATIPGPYPHPLSGRLGHSSPCCPRDTAHPTALLISKQMPARRGSRSGGCILSGLAQTMTTTG